MTPSPGRPDEPVHRALASPVRRRIVELVSGDDAPLDAHELADRLDLHTSTVRAHLAVLEEGGLVASSPEVRDRPGRPRLRYRATDVGRHQGGTGGYRFLAEVLVGQLAATTDDPSAVAEELGESWGRSLVDVPPPSAPLDGQTALDRVVALLDTFGFAPELDDADLSAPRLLVRRCPFLQVARQHQEVVCAIHLGIVRGALDQLGVDVEVRDLIPFVEPDLCVSHLRVRA